MAYTAEQQAIINEYNNAEKQTTFAEQAIQCVVKLHDEYYENGAVYDNTYSVLPSNDIDLSSYANWLYTNVPKTKGTLLKIVVCGNKGYELLLEELASIVLNNKYIESVLYDEPVGSILSFSGPFSFDNDHD